VSTAELDLPELLALARQGRLASLFGAARGAPALIVHLSDDASDGAGHGDGDDRDASAALDATDLGTLPVVLIGVGAGTGTNVDPVDVVAGNSAELDELVAAVHRQPAASTSLALLLRHGDQRSISAGLIAESTTYSMLQSGPAFRAWLAARPRRSSAATASRADEVLVDHDEVTMQITLNRPRRHNAVDTALSELLVEALTQALAQPSKRIVITGNGPSFCSGGDLDSFGSFSSPVDAHAIRLTRSAGQLIAMMADRVEVRLHGACIGAGIELAAFARTVHAASDVRIALPEVAFGLVPGAGGTVSLPRRIGRHRTALLALTGRTLDRAAALEWGLVDATARRP
jgi:hypothetical protein